MSDNQFPLGIEPKEDLPSRLVRLSGLPAKYWISAEDFNLVCQILQDKLDRGGTAANIITDESLFFDPLRKTLRSNISSSNDKFKFEGGSKSFILNNVPAVINFIAINDRFLFHNITQWSINTQLRTVTILEDLEPGDIINVNYHFIIS